MRTVLHWFALSLLLPACGGSNGQSHPTEPTAPAQAQPAPVSVATPTADFGSHWPGVTVSVESTGEMSDLAEGMSHAKFEVEWTEGQSAGVLYPKKFVVAGTDNEVAMQFDADTAGDIAAGVYDVQVSQDGRLGDGWLRNVRLEGPDSLRVVVDMNACMLALPLDVYSEVMVYPAGTYQDYQAKNQLDAIPDDDAISWYNSENKGAWAVAPSGKVDLKVTHADGTVEWRQGYELPANRKLEQL